MEIHARTTLDLRTCKALYRAVNRVKPAVGIGIFAVLTAYFVIGSFGNREDIPLAIISGAMLVLLLVLTFLGPKRSYNQLGKARDCVSEFVFYDDRFCVSTKFEGHDSSSEISYPNIEKVIETKEFFFIFQTKRSVFSGEKASIEGGTAEQLGAVLFNAVGKNYVVKK